MGRANLRKQEEKNGLVGAKNRGQDGPTHEKEKTNGLVGAKTGGGAGQPKETRGKEWISRG